MYIIVMVQQQLIHSSGSSQWRRMVSSCNISMYAVSAACSSGGGGRSTITDNTSRMYGSHFSTSTAIAIITNDFTKLWHNQPHQ